MRGLRTASRNRSSLQIRHTVNLKILYIVSFKPATICNLVTGLSPPLDMLVVVVVRVVLRSEVILFQLREEIFVFIKGQP